jgi:hypothetical protein
VNCFAAAMLALTRCLGDNFRLTFHAFDGVVILVFEGTRVRDPQNPVGSGDVDLEARAMLLATLDLNGEQSASGCPSFRLAMGRI